MPAYDAFLLVSFGGPEGPDDVMPFLQNVTRGRGVPPQRLASSSHQNASSKRCRRASALRVSFPDSAASPRSD